MIINCRRAPLTRLLFNFSKKPQPYTKTVKPGKSKEEALEDRVLAMKEREAFTNWLETHGNQSPIYMGAFFCGAALPLFLPAYGLVSTPYDDPLFLEYLHTGTTFLLGQSILFVGFF